MVTFFKRLVVLCALFFVSGAIVFVLTLEPEKNKVAILDDTGPNSEAELAKITVGPAPVFEDQIEPILTEHCIDCHGPDESEAGLRLDNLAGMLRGGKSGPALIPGKTISSLLVTAINYHDSTLHMPPDRKLAKRDILLLTHWIDKGAPHPESDLIEINSIASTIDLEESRKHWAFQPPVQPEVPDVADPVWLKTPVDAFILKGLQEQGLEVAPVADKRTLIRRVTFDLTGLPPTSEEIDSFLNDETPAAYPIMVERLLNSPQYGERWGRHWLDVARYSDSNGNDENLAYANAWHYRDYVVESFNLDKPYDQFLREQIAGDLLEANDDLKKEHELLIATGFLALGPKPLGEIDIEKMKMDVVDEQLDTLGRSLMGITLGCARCHDHKFDPISSADYYALAGIFKSTRTMKEMKKGPDQNILSEWYENPILNLKEQTIDRGFKDEVAAREKQIEQTVEEATEDLKDRLAKVSERFGVKQTIPENPEFQFKINFQEKLKKLRTELKEFKKAAPVLPSALGVTEGEIEDLSIHIRGSHLTLGEVVPRRFPLVLSQGEQSTFPAGESGRLKFAEWLTHPDHPLTSRIIVNRLWRWHFGHGLVKTTDNFGFQGELPSNQPLLDWLACEFVEQGFSMKRMHRMIVLSNTYQMSGKYHEQNALIDPENRYHWRYQGRRLEAEAIRDSVLVISEQLDRKFGGNLLNTENRKFVSDAESKESVNYDTNRRSIYMPIIRNHLHPVLQLFDYTNASALNGDRQTSTVATQALFLMNAPFMDRAATTLAEHLLVQDNEDARRIEIVYHKLYGRFPRTGETSRALKFLDQFQTDSSLSTIENRQIAWQALCHALLAANEFTYVQ